MQWTKREASAGLAESDHEAGGQPSDAEGQEKHEIDARQSSKDQLPWIDEGTFLHLRVPPMR